MTKDKISMIKEIWDNRASNFDLPKELVTGVVGVDDKLLPTTRFICQVDRNVVLQIWTDIVAPTSF